MRRDASEIVETLLAIIKERHIAGEDDLILDARRGGTWGNSPVLKKAVNGTNSVRR
jgi:hypothetical protein